MSVSKNPPETTSMSLSSRTWRRIRPPLRQTLLIQQVIRAVRSFDEQWWRQGSLRLGAQCTPCTISRQSEGLKTKTMYEIRGYFWEISIVLCPSDSDEDFHSIIEQGNSTEKVSQQSYLFNRVTQTHCQPTMNPYSLAVSRSQL